MLIARYGGYGELQSSSIEVEVVDTCFDTTILPQNIAQMTTYLGALEPAVRYFNIFNDQVSADYGD